MTWSIGFRAPGRVALADQAWSQHLDQFEESDWHDPWLKASDRPGEIPEQLLAALTRQVLQTFPNRKALRSAIARVLSEPAPSAVFAAPRPAPTLRGFSSAAKRHGIALSPASRLLYVDQAFYINGEAVSTPLTVSAGTALRDLANHRRLSAAQVKRVIQDPSLADCLLQMARAGWIVYH
jgi:50S ribosomal protein L16 3-hydroxylase